MHNFKDFKLKTKSLFKELNLLVMLVFRGITTNFVSLNPTHGEVCLIQHYVITFISDLRHADGFLPISRFPPPIKLTATI
jgi:hypothetical protein